MLRVEGREKAQEWKGVRHLDIWLENSGNVKKKKKKEVRNTLVHGWLTFMRYSCRMNWGWRGRLIDEELED